MFEYGDKFWGFECAAVPRRGQFYNVLYLLYRTQKSTLF